MPNGDAHMPTDTTYLCQEPGNLDVFDWLIDHAQKHMKKDDKTGEIRRNQEMAKGVCKRCPRDIKQACLNAFGRDYTMGVIGGMTDQEREQLFEGKLR